MILTIKRIASRVFWTVAQVTLGWLSAEAVVAWVDTQDWPQEQVWLPGLTLGFTTFYAWLKNYLATKVGDPTSTNFRDPGFGKTSSTDADQAQKILDGLADAA